MMEEEQTSSNGGRGNALKALVSFFTVWHMDIDQDDMNAMERSFHLVPLVGLLFAIVLIVEGVVLGWLSLNQGLGSGLFSAAVVLATVYAGSKFIHFDGLTDFGDGMVVSGQREDHVRALKDTLVGAGGVGTALIVVLLSVSAYSLAGAALLLVFAPVAELLVKNAMVFAAAFGKPGNGMAARQVSMTTRDSAIYSTLITLVLGIVLCAVTCLLYDAIIPYRAVSIEMLPVILAFIVAVAASALVGFLMARKSNEVFGMVNGDILGATNEICRPAVMFVMLLVFVLW